MMPQSLAFTKLHSSGDPLRPEPRIYVNLRVEDQDEHDLPVRGKTSLN